MAEYLQALILLFLAADFSHKTHRDLNCTQCHVPAPESTRAVDNLLPKTGACKPCHAEATVRAAPTVRFVLKFNHAAHGQMLTCHGCHRPSPEPGFPSMAFCIGCHNKIDMTDSCMKCHLPAQQLKPASHTSEFFETHSNKRVDTRGCAVCHGRDFTCQGCH